MNVRRGGAVPPGTAGGSRFPADAAPCGNVRARRPRTQAVRAFGAQPTPRLRLLVGYGAREIGVGALPG